VAIASLRLAFQTPSTSISISTQRLHSYAMCH
jgi:hypothetical protein